MASIQPKRFEVALFFEVSLREPDVHQEVVAFTELFAVQQVMQVACLKQAKRVWVVAQNGQTFLFRDVQLVNACLRYGSVTIGSVARSTSTKLTV